MAISQWNKLEFFWGVNSQMKNLSWRDRHFIHLRFSTRCPWDKGVSTAPYCRWKKNRHRQLIGLFDPSHGAKFLDHFLRYFPSIFDFSPQFTPVGNSKFHISDFQKIPSDFWVLPYLSSEMQLFFWSRCLRAILQVQVFILALSWRCSPSSMGVEMSNFRLNSTEKIGPYKSLDLQTLEV